MQRDNFVYKWRPEVNGDNEDLQILDNDSGSVSDEQIQ
jgi:hypothetical protein